MQKNLNRELDNDFKQIGEFGLYQLLIFVLVGLISCIPAILAYSYIFIAATPEFRCKIPNYDNDTYDIIDSDHQSLVDKYIPFENKTIKIFDKCKINNFNYDNLNQSNGTSKCDSWVFSRQYYGKTIVNDWKLICDNSAKKSTYSSVYFAGAYGILLIGIMSDKIGRKKTAFIYLTLNAIFNGLFAILMNINIDNDLKQIFYGILRFLTGIVANIYSLTVVLAIEVTGPSYRLTAASCMYYFYILGEYITVLICYFIREYNHIYICVASIMLCYPIYFWVVPESPRWLLTNGKYRSALNVLKKIADSNKKVLPERYELLVLNNDNKLSENAVIEEDTDKKNEKSSFLKTLKHICKSKKLLIRTIAIIFNWITNNFVYYGISLGVNQLAGNPYLNYTLLVTNELIAVTCTHFVLNKFGRKWPYVINMGLAGLSLLGVLFTPKSLPILVTIIALIGKFTISFTYNTIYLITSELYPTVVRNTAITICQTFARSGAVIAPNINLLGELYWYPIPFIVYGSFATISTILTIFFIPETNNTKLPDTIDDIK